MSIKPRGYWTKERCKVSAAGYQTRMDWQRGNYNAYDAAKKKGWLDECCTHMVLQLRTHTLESCKSLAASYKTKMHWQQSDRGAYEIAYRKGWLDECCAHMMKRRTHTLESCKASAADYQTRSDWERGDYNAYQTAKKRGWFDECCAHMGDALGYSDADTLYVWEAVGLDPTKRVYKVGITSWRLGDHRIKEVASAAGCEARMVLYRFMGKWNTPTLEAHLLTFGQPFMFSKMFNGCTEFRSLTEQELAAMVNMVEAHPIL